jgi:type IV pilus assembly protein PilV
MKQNHSTIIIKRSRDKGFTLLEVIVAISILAFGLLAVASMQATAIRGNSFAIGTTEATTCAADQAEKLMALPYDDANLDDGDHSATEGRYSIDWTVTDDTPTTDSKTINVIVTWTFNTVYNS